MSIAGSDEPIRIDLVSDTATRPTAAMRRAIAEAPVGDEQRGEDPSVNALTDRVAALLGKEAAIFLPSGTMCNQIALAVHCRPGDEIIAADTAHVIGSEGAGAAVFAGAVIRALPTRNGIFTAEQLGDVIRPRKVKSPCTRAVVIEQTNNRGGGSVWSLAEIQEVAELARARGLALHMDGARLMNAVVSSAIEADRFAASFDSVWLDLSKGLGCPIGGVLAGSTAFIEAATIWKHRFGGAMRQAGIIAAAGIYALDHNIDRLRKDHENARRFAAAIGSFPGIAICNPKVETNLVFFDVSATSLTPSTIAARLLDRGIRIGVEDASVMRAVFHLDVDAKQSAEAAAALGEAISHAHSESLR